MRYTYRTEVEKPVCKRCTIEMKIEGYKIHDIDVDVGTMENV